jgi:hypothetical protein
MSINWGPTGVQYQGLLAYLESLGIDATTAGNVVTMVNRITLAYANLVTHLPPNAVASSTGNQGYVPDFTLELAFSGLTRFITDVCAGTWSDVGGGAPQTASVATVLAWMTTYRPDISSQLATLLKYVVATDINSNLLPSAVTAPTTVVIGNDASSSKNIYMRAVGTLLRNVAQWLRYYCGATKELDQMNYNYTGATGAATSSSYGSYIEGLDVVKPTPTPVT